MRQLTLPRGRPTRERSSLDDDGSPGRQLLASVVAPGSASVGRRPVLSVLLMLLGVAPPIALGIWALVRRDDPVGLAVDTRFLGAVTAVGVAAIAARLAAIGEVAYEFRYWEGVGPRTAVATVVTLALALPVLWAASTANETRQAVAVVFDEGEAEGPLFNPDPAGAPAAGESVSGASTAGAEGDASAADSAVDSAAITNILLLGGDAEPGRFGMNTDSIIVVSVNTSNGRTALVSIPSDLARLRFPPDTPLGDHFPDGFSEYEGLTKAVFSYVVDQPELMEYYGASGFDPRALALAQGIGYSLNLRIDEYALVNMEGFKQIIDAVGGVTIDLAEAVPLRQSVGGDGEIPQSVGPGTVEMDGGLAVAFVRSRENGSDYDRMNRQRQLLAALGSQVSVGDALSGVGEVAGALEDSLRTSMSGPEFADMLDLLGDSSKIGESIGLVPPLIDPAVPDWEAIRAIIDAEQRYVATGRPSGYAS